MSTNLIALQNRFLDPKSTIYEHLSSLHATKGAISAQDIVSLARELSLPLAHVRSVAQFYDELRLDAPSVPVRLCNGEACVVAGAPLRRACLERDLGANRVGKVTCLGACSSGPNALIQTDGESHVVSLDCDQTLAEVNAAVKSRRLVDLPEPVNSIRRSKKGPEVLFPYFCPRDADLEIAQHHGAYRALKTALKDDPVTIIEAVKVSGLRGRGGAGFPTGLKMETVRNAPSTTGERYVVLNADEGDAGATIDKELIERAPHTVIEGVILAAFAVGATAGWIYLRGEYPRAHETLNRALTEARGSKLLGEHILGSELCFDLKIVRGHGSYVCGEETSLLRSLEGLPGHVTPKPPYPAVEGLWGAPTLVNNVETLANLPFIVEHGGGKYAAFGTAKSRGTKLVSLNTAVARPGLYEVELGTTIREVIFDLAGGMAEEKQFKAVQIGGPLGGLFAEQHLDLPLDFEAMSDAGGLLGHGGMVVFPDDVDLVEIGRGIMRFCATESCGKCFPCRLGATRGTEIFEKILSGKGAQTDLDLLAELLETMRLASLCALGGGVPLPISNLLTWFLSDFSKYVPGAVTPKPLVDGESR